MKFWKEHVVLRMVLMLTTFVGGMALLIYGWGLTGKLSGLGLMLLGVVCLLATLAIYNKPFETPKEKKKSNR